MTGDRRGPKSRDWWQGTVAAHEDSASLPRRRIEYRHQATVRRAARDIAWAWITRQLEDDFEVSEENYEHYLDESLRDTLLEEYEQAEADMEVAHRDWEDE